VWKYRVLTEDQIIALLCINHFNTFGIWDEYHQCIGLGIYPRASFFNHSCAPNVYRSELLSSSLAPQLQSRRIISFKALHPIPRGSEVCISYSDVDLAKQVRQDYLLYQFHFKCLCSRCSAEDETNDDFVSLYICPKCSMLCEPEHVANCGMTERVKGLSLQDDET